MKLDTRYKQINEQKSRASENSRSPSASHCPPPTALLPLPPGSSPALSVQPGRSAPAWPVDASSAREDRSPLPRCLPRDRGQAGKNFPFHQLQAASCPSCRRTGITKTSRRGSGAAGEAQPLPRLPPPSHPRASWEGEGWAFGRSRSQHASRTRCPLPTATRVKGLAHRRAVAESNPRCVYLSIE